MRKSAEASRLVATALGLALVVLALALYASNWNDYFLGDDFDLIHSFHDEPFGYFAALLFRNESGDVWKSWGIDPALGRGYLRPLKIWLLALDFRLWGTNPLGYHLTSSACFAAIVVLVFAIARRALRGRVELAAAGAAAVAMHPVFAEVVPFVTAREELLANALGLAAFLCFLRHREEGRPSWPFQLFYVLALLTKESAIVLLALPLGWDLVQGRVWPLSRERIAALLRTYVPTAAAIALYFGLRFVAFGNFLGGDGVELHYLSPAAFAAFHARFWQSLADPTLLAYVGGGVGPAMLGTALAALVVAIAWSWPRIPLERRRALLFFGPLWYVAATAILHGTYFAVRHNLLPVIGIALFVTVALDTILSLYRPHATRVCAIAWVAVAACFFLPPARVTSREWSEAAALVSELRASIDARTARLPAGCAVSIVGVPQWTLPPFLFGWGLRSALSHPFTASDLARVCTVLDPRNVELTRYDAAVPERFDVDIVFEPKRLVPQLLRDRQLLRLWRDGAVERGASGFE